MAPQATVLLSISSGITLKQQGYEMLHVPFNGIAPAMAALAGGQIDLAITNLASSLPLAADRKSEDPRVAPIGAV